MCLFLLIEERCNIIEIWKDIVGFEGLYMISNLGNIKRLSRSIVAKDGKTHNYKEKAITPILQKDGYYRIWLRNKDGVRKPFYVHRLVYTTFVGEIPNNKVINHIDCCKTNNMVNNLECITQQENVIHGIKNGCRKNKKPNSK